MHPKFKALRDMMSKIPKINQGGCALAALAMYYVGKEVGMTVHIMYLYDYECDTNFCKNTEAMNGSGDVTYCCHAVCVVDNQAMDSTDLVDVADYPFKHFVPEDFVVKTLQKQGIWRDDFDRNAWQPRIEAFLG